MFGTIGKISRTIIAIMGLCVSIGLAIGFSLLTGTFYLIWRCIRAIEKRS